MPVDTVGIDGNHLTLEDFYRIAVARIKAVITPEAKVRIRACRQTLEKMIESDTPFYGVNTGFGALASRRISPQDLQRLQVNLIRSHAAGVGDFFPEPVVRGIILLRANVLAKGHSGVRLEVVQLLLELLNRGIIPRIPVKGSVGASGDLAPLSHLALVLIGEGEVVFERKVMPGDEAILKAGLKPLTLKEKEGIALINGTQVMTAVGILALLEAERLVKIADIAGSLTFEAQLGSLSPFLEEIQDLRPFPGQGQSAKNIRTLVADSPLWNSHKGKNKIQDAYSIRCIPQVHGAVRETLRFVRETLQVEINAATENPLIFPDKEAIISGGNFHGEPVALAMDYLTIAMTELGNISERRIDRLVNPATNQGLPHFLVANSGLNSGFMPAHVTASSLTSENRSLAHPASVDNIPTSANQEDHVSMGTIGARKSLEVVGNCKYILAIEILAALQALDFYSLPCSPPLYHLKTKVREKIPFIQEDVRMDQLISAMVEMIDGGVVLRTVEEHSGPLS